MNAERSHSVLNSGLSYRGTISEDLREELGRSLLLCVGSHPNGNFAWELGIWSFIPFVCER